jgi:hypothetical protein
MKYLLILLSAIAFTASANNLPSLGSTGTGSEVTTASGASCRTGTQRTTVDMGITSKRYDDNSMGNINPQAGLYNFNTPQDTGMVYARIVIPIGAKKSQLDCSRMYNLELNRMKSENELLRQQLANLRNSAVIVTVE